MHGILQNIEIREVGAPVTAASNTDSNSDRIDMSNYESVAFVTFIEDSVATGVATFSIQENDADSDTGMAAPALGAIAATATCAVNDDINGTMLAIETYHPGKRYVQAVRVSATANIAFGSVIALLVPRQRPVSNHATVSSVARDNN